MNKVVVHPKDAWAACSACLPAQWPTRNPKACSPLLLSTQGPDREFTSAWARQTQGFPTAAVTAIRPLVWRLACRSYFLASDRETVLIDPDKCINCASCAMACPFGVLRFHPDFAAPPDKAIAVKCDNCGNGRLRALSQLVSRRVKQAP